MYVRLKRMYEAGTLNETHLNNAVAKGWISEIEKAEIVAG